MPFSAQEHQKSALHQILLLLLNSKCLLNLINYLHFVGDILGGEMICPECISGPVADLEK